MERWKDGKRRARPKEGTSEEGQRQKREGAALLQGSILSVRSGAGVILRVYCRLELTSRTRGEFTGVNQNEINCLFLFYIILFLRQLPCLFFFFFLLFCTTFWWWWWFLIWTHLSIVCCDIHGSKTRWTVLTMGMPCVLCACWSFQNLCHGGFF